MTGIELCGWSTLDSLEPARAYPPELLAEVRASSAPGPPHREICPADGRGAARLARRACAHRRHRWRRWRSGCCGAIGSTCSRSCLPGLHRCGHRLWDDTGLKGATDARSGPQLAERWPRSTAPATRRSAGCSRPRVPTRSSSTLSTAWGRTRAGSRSWRRCWPACWRTGRAERRARGDRAPAGEALPPGSATG